MPPADALFARLRAPGAVLLDAPRTDPDTGRAGAWLYDQPRDLLVARRTDEVETVLHRMDAALAQGFHVAGAMAYEAGAAFVPSVAAPAPADVPLAWFGVYGPPEPVSDLDAALATLPDPVVEAPAFAWDEATYADRVAAVHAAIREGDVYQINLTLPVTFGLAGDPLALFAALRRRQRVAYGAWLSLGDDTHVASVSPELFVRIDPDGGGRVATARPMKGTTTRGLTPVEDDALAEALVGRAKDRAENLMIVDLLRNDLSRVAVPGSVRVPTLFASERYDTVTQMTSTVEARLQADATLGDVMRAAFPCGSITGAPKPRAMQLIASLEDAPRGLYCGAIGAASPDGRAAFNVAIRTAVVRQGRGVYGVGSGIVWDSEAGAEWAECALKARIVTSLAP